MKEFIVGTYYIVLILRFDPAASAYREIEKLLIKIKEDKMLYRLFAASIKTNNSTNFQATLQQVTTPIEQG